MWVLFSKNEIKKKEKSKGGANFDNGKIIEVHSDQIMNKNWAIK